MATARAAAAAARLLCSTDYNELVLMSGVGPQVGEAEGKEEEGEESKGTGKKGDDAPVPWRCVCGVCSCPPPPLPSSCMSICCFISETSALKVLSSSRILLKGWFVNSVDPRGTATTGGEDGKGSGDDG